MASRIATLLLLGVVCVGFVTAEIVVDCCLKTSSKRFPLSAVSSYTIQEAGQGCAIRATAIITRTGKTLCLSHPSEETWMINFINRLEEKLKNQA
ncbi:C-C motif chemokine 21b isoform X2 [Labrus bergylta]|uniref:C-C motif chemokine 21b isoform X2 n=1 Tax=Labrus bergylta TaxID=56723 RepID=UPI0009B34D3A|nr:C-C motif chemokine 21-like isoform X2 [Labrus bergylta]